MDAYVDFAGTSNAAISLEVDLAAMVNGGAESWVYAVGHLLMVTLHCRAQVVPS
jgi:hypothetical protein